MLQISFQIQGSAKVDERPAMVPEKKADLSHNPGVFLEPEEYVQKA